MIEMLWSCKLQVILFFSRDLKSLEKFRVQQKQIEEANKQKKALLSKTLTER